MASLSKQALTDPKNLGKMSFLDMSLDYITILGTIEYSNFEENKNYTQNERQKNLVSKQQSNVGEHHQQRNNMH
uniref:Leucine zipper protein 4 n=1 Tax=Pipistrellus kuhlii TaxID=59472 RepID=A0A7J7TIJ1_PIPKU|nr:leucine zipper protein 4 [Pipistrellus kuhlii]